MGTLASSCIHRVLLTHCLVGTHAQLAENTRTKVRLAAGKLIDASAQVTAPTEPPPPSLTGNARILALRDRVEALETDHEKREADSSSNSTSRGNSNSRGKTSAATGANSSSSAHAPGLVAARAFPDAFVRNFFERFVAHGTVVSAATLQTIVEGNSAASSAASAASDATSTSVRDGKGRAKRSASTLLTLCEVVMLFVRTAVQRAAEYDSHDMVRMAELLCSDRVGDHNDATAFALAGGGMTWTVAPTYGAIMTRATEAASKVQQARTAYVNIIFA